MRRDDKLTTSVQVRICAFGIAIITSLDDVTLAVRPGESTS